MKNKEVETKKEEETFIVLEVYLSNKSFESKIALPLIGSTDEKIKDVVAQFYQMVESALKMGR